MPPSYYECVKESMIKVYIIEKHNRYAKTERK